MTSCSDGNRRRAGAGQQLHRRHRRLQSRRRTAAMSSSGPTATCAAATSPAPAFQQSRRPEPAAPTTSCSSATGTPGPSRASSRACSALRSIQRGLSPAPAVPLTGDLVGDTPSKPFGGGEEIALSPDGTTAFFTLREAGRIEPLSTNLDIFAVPADGSAAAGQPHRLRTTPPTRFRPSLPTGRHLPMSQWRGRATNPTARSSSFAISLRARFGRSPQTGIARSAR